MSNRLDQDRETRLQPTRIEEARKQIIDLGYAITFEDKTKIIFEYKGKDVIYFPYSGWATGPTITDGRGLRRLVDQIKNK